MKEEINDIEMILYDYVYNQNVKPSRYANTFIKGVIRNQIMCSSATYVYILKLKLSTRKGAANQLDWVYAPHNPHY